jgi:ABC-2 type transport system ATP-binding protein
VEELCDHITLINKAENILEGPIDEIRNQYKTNIYQVEFNGNFEDIESSLNQNYEILERKTINGNNAVRIKLHHHTTDNELLSLILPAVEIIAFREEIPGMNEIFIKAVNEYQPQENSVL